MLKEDVNGFVGVYFKLIDFAQLRKLIAVRLQGGTICLHTKMESPYSGIVNV